VKTIVSCIDAKKLKMFNNEGVLEVLRESLEYETFEQICLWQLLTAHEAFAESRA
jgi:integrator complex subunit 3